MNSDLEKFCAVCGFNATNRRNGSADKSHVDCGRCGRYSITGSAQSILGDPSRSDGLLDTDLKKASVGHWLRGQQRFEEEPMLSAGKIEQLAIDPYFPSVKEQLELLVEYIGDSVGSVGAIENLDSVTSQYIYGGSSASSLKALVRHLDEAGVLDVEGSYDSSSDETFLVSLSVRGWLHYEEIVRGSTSGRTAFMAMPFGRADLDDEWLPLLRLAVAETGYNLKRVDDEPEPGLIDTKMRLQIQAARFLIVELTHANNGAYWEAGLAEGLGKPVIYTCKANVKPHFDVEHAFRVIWDPDDFEPALRTLKATIRNALPDAKAEQET